MSYTKTALAIAALITLLIGIYVDVSAAAVLAFAGVVVIGILKYFKKGEYQDPVRNSKPVRTSARKKPVPPTPKPFQKLQKPGAPTVKVRQPRALPSWKMPRR